MATKSPVGPKVTSGQGQNKRQQAGPAGAGRALGQARMPNIKQTTPGNVNRMPPRPGQK